MSLQNRKRRNNAHNFTPTKKDLGRRSKSTRSTSREGISLLEPSFKQVNYSDFENLAKTYDSLIAEFYEYYKESGHSEPNMFGFVTVQHIVKFSKDADTIYTENVIGQKATIIYAPFIQGESEEEQNDRRLKLLAAFDQTKKASHILALSLLAGLLSGQGIRKLIHKHEEKTDGSI